MGNCMSEKSKSQLFKPPITDKTKSLSQLSYSKRAKQKLMSSINKPNVQPTLSTINKRDPIPIPDVKAPAQSNPKPEASAIIAKNYSEQPFKIPSVIPNPSANIQRQEKPIHKSQNQQSNISVQSFTSLKKMLYQSKREPKQKAVKPPSPQAEAFHVQQVESYIIPSYRQPKLSQQQTSKINLETQKNKAMHYNPTELSRISEVNSAAMSATVGSRMGFSVTKFRGSSQQLQKEIVPKPQDYAYANIGLDDVFEIQATKIYRNNIIQMLVDDDCLVTTCLYFCFSSPVIATYISPFDIKYIRNLNMQPVIDPIESFFRDRNIQSRLHHQLSLLSDSNIKYTVHNSSTKLHIRVSLPSEKYTFKLLNEQIVFDFVLGKGYPLTVPRLYLKTGLFQPFVNDFRDFMSDVLQEPWSWKMRLVMVVGRLDKFLIRLSEDAQNSLVIQKLGKYYLGERFTLAELGEFKPVQIYQAFKLETDRIVMHYLAISESHIFILVPNAQPNVFNGKLQVPAESQIKSLHLFQYAQLQCFTEIRTNRDDSQLVLTLRTHRQKKLVLEPVTLKLTYRIVNVRNFLRKVLRAIPKFQTVDIDYQTARKDGFTPIMASIKAAQQNLQRYLNKENIGELNKCYQNAVEYLSGDNDPAYLIYLNKIAQLFLREDVKLVSGLKL